MCICVLNLPRHIWGWKKSLEIIDSIFLIKFVFVYLLVAWCAVALFCWQGREIKKGLLREMGCSTAVYASVLRVGEQCSCCAFLKSASPWWCIWGRKSKASEDALIHILAINLTVTLSNLQTALSALSGNVHRIKYKTSDVELSFCILTASGSLHHTFTSWD